MRTVFRNATTYNPVGSWVHENANKLLKMYEKKSARLFAEAVLEGSFFFLSLPPTPILPISHTPFFPYISGYSVFF